MSYHVDRFNAAVSVLVGDGHIKQRLVTAFQEYLDDIRGNELPRDVRSPFAELTERMRRVAPLNGEGAIRASVRKMSAAEASHCAELILGMFRDLVRRSNEVDESLPERREAAEAPPPFLVKSAS